MEKYDVLSIDELAALLANPEELERPVTEGASPLTVVDLSAAVRRPGELPASRPPPWRVLVGWSPTAFDAQTVSQFDVLLTGGAEPDSAGWVRSDDPARSIEQIASACQAAPLAAVTLAQLLRLRTNLSLADALVAESVAYSMLLAGPEFAAWRRQGLPASRPSAEPVLVADDGTAVTITLNRPEVRNAYSAGMRDRLVDILRGLLAGPTHPPIVLRGNGPAFCSGGDLSEFGTTPDPVTAHSIRISRSPGLLLDDLGDVTAIVHGACVGAGVELPAFCHRVVARPGTTFRLPEVAMGLLPGAGGTASLPRRIGRRRTAYLGLSGEALTVDVAVRWGLVDEIVDD